jgi:hypothetical protein
LEFVLKEEENCSYCGKNNPDKYYIIFSVRIINGFDSTVYQEYDLFQYRQKVACNS